MTSKLSHILEDAVRDGFRKALDLSGGGSATNGREHAADAPSGETRPDARRPSHPGALGLDSLGGRS